MRPRSHSLPKLALFTRSPESGAPATYTGTDAIDTLILADQPSEITISGLEENDIIVVSAAALAANSLSAYKVYGNDGADFISVTSAQLSGSTVQGGAGNDAINFTANAVVNTSVIRGGADDDVISASNLQGATVNGNLGSDTITVTGAVFSSRVYGGSENDVIAISGATAIQSRFNGSKGADTIAVDAGSVITGSSVFGGEGADVITVAVGNGSTLFLSGDKGDDTITATGVTVGGTVLGGIGDDNIAVGGTAAADTFTIDAGEGADSVIVGTGTDAITFAQGDSVAAAGNSQFGGAAGTGTALTVTDFIQFNNGVDTISGFTSGTDSIDISIAVPAAITNLDASALSTQMAATGISEFTGTFAGNTFTFDSVLGTDFLYVIGGSNRAISTGLFNNSNILVSDNALALADFV